MSLDDCVINYFEKSFSYGEILEFLRTQDGYNISLSTLKRHLGKLGLVRRPTQNARCDTRELGDAVRVELAGSGSGVGYRRIHRSLIRKGFICRREDVRRLIKTIDSESVESRKKGD